MVVGPFVFLISFALASKHGVMLGHAIIILVIKKRFFKTVDPYIGTTHLVGQLKVIKDEFSF